MFVYRSSAGRSKSMSSSHIRQSSYVLSGSTRRTMSGMTPSRSSFWAMMSGSVSPSKATSTGAFMLICSARVPRMRARSYFVSTGAVTRSLPSRLTAEPLAARPDRTTSAPSPSLCSSSLRRVLSSCSSPKFRLSRSSSPSRSDISLPSPEATHNNTHRAKRGKYHTSYVRPWPSHAEHSTTGAADRHFPAHRHHTHAQQITGTHVRTPNKGGQRQRQTEQRTRTKPTTSLSSHKTQ
ncbi:hypothetical protein TCSYLVIO_003968 [Trypanosoma cruzi]|nr:hypothetical protein TCSYLVIO_003968 [Trypanosoma cruzi]